jgi:hypothetical protein
MTFEPKFVEILHEIRNEIAQARNEVRVLAPLANVTSP